MPSFLELYPLSCPSYPTCSDEKASSSLAFFSSCSIFPDILLSQEEAGPWLPVCPFRVLETIIKLFFSRGLYLVNISSMEP